MFRTPSDAIQHPLVARARGDIAAAVACYDPSATVVPEPGRTETGEAAITSFSETAARLPITFGERAFVEADGIALHVSQWTIVTDTGAEISGRTSDVLRRQANGGWLVLIDNPWGSQILDRTSR